MPTSKLHDQAPVEATPLVRSLVEQAREIEVELAKFLERIQQAGLEFEKAVAAATLVSRERAAAVLDASTDQVGRWSSRGELTVVDLDRRPRYRLRDLEGFADSRIRGGRRSAKNSGAAQLPPAKHENQNQK
jgi:hypothetical protein